MRVSSLLALALGLADGAFAGKNHIKPIHPPLSDFAAKSTGHGMGALAEPHVGQGLFDQLIDHSQPQLGTFKQRFYYSTMYYKGPGYPIAMEAPSEAALDPRSAVLNNITMVGLIAQNLGGAAVSLEHRFYGESSPVARENLNAETLQPLTIENAIDDLVYFARNVKLPFDPEGKSHPDRAPWTLSGCSYAGALAAWTEALAPGTFWAYEAGSAVVEALDDLWQYYIPVEKAMPRNCSADYRSIVEHVDDVIHNGTPEQKMELKDALGFTDESDEDTVGGVSNWLYNWQYQQYADGYSVFFRVCDYIENQWPGSTEPAPGLEGVGLEKALQGLGRIFKEFSTDADSGESEDDEKLIDPWNWQLCNEPFEWWPTDRPRYPFHMTTRDRTRQFAIQRTCDGNFPDVGGYKYRLKDGRNYHATNRLTGGWHHHNSTRVAFVNADMDPWLYTTVSSPLRDSGPLQSTEQAPVYFLHGTAHCNDYVTANYAANEEARAMFDGVISHMKKWVDEFYDEHNVTRPM